MTEPPKRPRSLRRFLLLSFGTLAILALIAVGSVICLPAWIGSAILVNQCPDGEVRQTLFIGVNGVRRGGEGAVHVGARAHFTTEDADWAQQVPVRRLSAELFIVDAAGVETRLETKDRRPLEEAHFQRYGTVILPQVPDGDYLLRAKVKTPIASGVIDLPLPLYAPARVHVITDRPLYQPGQSVSFRALALRAVDLTPLDGRPGRFIVEDPSGEVILEEKAPAGELGIVAGTFPLDAEATSGPWRVRWVSGPTEGNTTFQVEPFRLPRFRVEAEASRAFYSPGDAPRVRGSVRYASGAPVVGAEIAFSWSSQGAWPLPTRWLEGELPVAAKTDRAGAFELALPRVPGDLVDQVSLRAAISAIDPAGDRVSGGVSLLLSQDPIHVEAVTELGDGLVEGFNNRLFLRATTAAGVPLPKTELTVRRAWETGDRGVVTVTDEDGVAALQIDPGPAVNIVIPPLPARPPPREPPIQRGEAAELISGEEPSLADQRAMDGWLPALEPCARFSAEPMELSLALRVDPAGRVLHVGHDATPLGGCLADVLGTRRLSAGAERLLRVSLSVTGEDLPSLNGEVEGAPFVLDEIEGIVERAALDARGCLSADTTADALPRLLVWRTVPKDKRLSVSWVRPREPLGEILPSAAEVTCIESRVQALTLDEPASAETLGTVRFSVTPAARVAAATPSATTMLGYELEISAAAGKEALGKTRLRLSPGQVPSLRLRATPVLAEAGGTVDVEILRGPGFSGKLPEKLHLGQPGKTSIEAKLDPKARTARFTLPGDAKGWFEVSWAGARATIFVPSGGDLEVSLQPERERYAPKETARLMIETRAGGRGTPAALSLIGVDESLGQLAALPGPEVLEALRPQVETSLPAFGVLDAQALGLGRIRGANAAQAVVLRVSALPPADALDLAVNGSFNGPFDPLEPLTDHFYGALAELHAAVRQWEGAAPPDQQMTPAKMAELWSQALGAAEKRGVPVDDAFGRRLRLSRLPPDLLALTAPHAVVVKGTRLPEDVEDWASWVQRERP
ncbi:MAG: hypothetical protein IT384_11715 [Deltaproteobacteria bacterium]|nr:hypothetical protein [Deltaproteobacteria bacterium]